MSSATLEWDGPAPPAELEIFEERCKSALSTNDSPDIGFRYSVNPYRGCFHACAYCYARPSHQYLGFGAGTDFDRRIVVKVNVAEELEKTLRKPSWKRDLVVFSGNTDCYQPLEASYELTRRCLEVCHTYATPVSVITKSKLVRRDAALLGAMTRVAGASVAVSIPFASDEDARAIEPFASPPAKRFETIACLVAEGIPVTVAVAPIIPGLNDAQIPEILERAREAGATSAFSVLLRLAGEVKPVFLERLQEAFPLRAKKVISAIRDVRGGEMYDSRFGSRMHGQGARWQAIDMLFRTSCKRLGLVHRDEDEPRSPEMRVQGPSVEPPTPKRQLTLFEE
jgi:DNA repair photolyase